MAAPSPRKFHEKIALLQQKQVEDSAEFDDVMRSIRHITRPVRMCTDNLFFTSSAMVPRTSSATTLFTS